jgi:hypothetical protein
LGWGLVKIIEPPKRIWFYDKDLCVGAFEPQNRGFEVADQPSFHNAAMPEVHRRSHETDRELPALTAEFVGELA